MASSSSSGPLLARGISHGGIAGATVGAVLGATILFLLFLPFILRAIRETRYRRRISSDNAEMGYAGASSVAYGADREPFQTLFYPPDGTLPPVATLPGGCPCHPDQFGLQAPPATYYPGGTPAGAPTGPTTTLGDSSSSEAGKVQDGLASAPSSEEPAQQTAVGPADAQPDAAAPTSAAAAPAETDVALTTAAASAATPAVPAPTTDGAPSALLDQTAASATPTEPAAPAAPEAPVAPAASEGLGAPAAPAVSSPASDALPAAPSPSGRPPAVAPIDTALAQDAAASVSAEQMRTPPPLARGVAATFPAFHAQPSLPYQPRQRSATTRSIRSRRSPSLLDRAASLFRSNSSRVELTRGPPGGRQGPDLSRSPVTLGFQSIEGPDHHLWLMTEQGVRIEPEFPGHSVFEVDVNNLTGLSAEYYSEEPLSEPTESPYLMYPSSYAPTPPSALASSLAGMAATGALVGVAATPERQTTPSESAPQANSLSLPTAGKIATDKAVSPLPPSPTSPSPYTRTKFSAANGDRVGWMEDVQEEPHEEVQDDPTSRKGSESSTSAAATSVRGELTPDPAEFMRSPSHLTLVPSPRLPAPGTVNPRDVWAPATDDERFVHKTAELDRIEQTPPAGPMEAAPCTSTASAATSSPSAQDSDGGVGSVSGTSGTSGMSGMSGVKPDEEIDPVVVPDELRQSTEVSEPSDSGAPFMPALQRNSMPTPEQIGAGMSPAPQMKAMPASATPQPTLQVTTPDSFESPENYESPEVYESSPENLESQQQVQSQQNQVYETQQPDKTQFLYYSSPDDLSNAMGSGGKTYASGSASASVHPAYAQANAPMHVPTHDAPAQAMAHVPAPMNSAHDQGYAATFANNNPFPHMVPQQPFAGDFSFNYNLSSQGGYLADNMFPSLPSGKMSDFAMVQQPSDAQFYWPVTSSLAMMPEQPYTSPGHQRNESGLYYPIQALGHADAMLYHQHGGGAGAPQHLPSQTPQSSPGYASAGFSDDSAVQMQSLPSATSSSSAAPIGKPVSPPLAKPAGQPFVALSVPGADGATQPLSPLSSQGSSQPNTPALAPIPRGFTCDECGRSFDQIHKLNHHKRYHERPHECTVSGCGKRFGTKTHLDRHFNDKHSKSRKYHCTEEGCPYSVVGGKSFPRKDNWRRHMVNKHGVQPEHEPIEVVDVPMMGMPV